jgi:hypothetical protein|tara:strand:- start:2220 stop:2333 length:114 start_codon:yes stop_codon:yes gene_type:complete
MKPRFFTDDYGNKWMEFDSKLFPGVRNKIILPKEEEE